MSHGRQRTVASGILQASKGNVNNPLIFQQHFRIMVRNRVEKSPRDKRKTSSPRRSNAGSTEVIYRNSKTSTSGGSPRSKLN